MTVYWSYILLSSSDIQFLMLIISAFRWKLYWLNGCFSRMLLNCSHQYCTSIFRKGFGGSVDLIWTMLLKSRLFYFLNFCMEYIGCIKNHRYSFQLLFDVHSRVQRSSQFCIHICEWTIQNINFATHFHFVDYNLGMLQIQNQTTK